MSPPHPVTIPPPGTSREELGRLWTLSWPVSVGGLGMLAMGLVDTATVAVLGDLALATTAAANMWVFGVGTAARGLLMGLDPIVAQAFGRGDRAESGAALRAGLVVSVGLSVLLVVAHQLTGPALALLGQPSSVLADASAYAVAVGWGVPGWVLFWALRQFLQGTGRMRAATAAVVVANVLNVLLNGTLVLGWFGVTPLGVVGAGWATAVSSWCMAAVLTALEAPVLLRYLRDAAPPGDEVVRLVRQGTPISLQVGLEVWAFIATGVIVGWMGTTALAAHEVVLLLASVSFMVPLGVSGGASTRVGNLVGAGHPWVRAGWVAVGLGAGVMVVTGALFLLMPEALASALVPHGAARELAVRVLPIAGAFQIFDGLQVTCAGVLRGMGDVRVPSAFNMVAYWVVTVPLAYALGHTLGYGVAGVWWAVVVGLGLVSVLLVTRVAVMGRRSVARLRVSGSGSAHTAG